MRSLYKAPFVHRSVMNKYVERRKRLNVHSEIQSVLNRRKIKLSRSVIFWNKSSKFVKNRLIGRKIAIHNGKVYMFVGLKKGVVGFKLGQFVITRRTVIHSGKFKQKKKLAQKGKDLSKSRKRYGGKFNLTLKKYVGKKRVKRWA